MEEPVRRMMRTIAHRGPDGEGIHCAGPVALGHRRLSIIDLSAAGAQPMTLDGTTLVYNGESYNFVELRRELAAAGHQFVGHSDTEVALHAYAEWGPAGLTRLEGMFALALWDAPRQRLLLMRDRLGIKPLYYAWHGGQLAFGSEIKAVLAGVNADRGTDEQAFAEYLWYGNTFDERTMYRGVRSLPPGHRLIVAEGRCVVEPWWGIEEWLSGPPPADNPQDAARLVRDAVDSAVARQLVSDVPVGIFLSGGVDSSSIAAAAVATNDRRLVSFTAGFDYERGQDELAKARGIAARLGLDHHELHVGSESLEEAVIAMVRAHDEPFADAANIPLYLLAKALHGAVKVVLQGDGGDEMFAGYRRYAILRNAHWWRLWPGGLDRLTAVLGSSGARLGRLGAAASAPPAMRMALLLTMETLREPPDGVLQPAARARLAARTDPFLAFRRCADRFPDADPVQQMLLTDISLQLPSQFLPKVDRATMAASLETRVPLLDEKVAALAVRLPATLKVRGSQKKIVLRDAMRDRLPAQTLDGPKTGFGVPYGQWLRGPLRELARATVVERAFIERFELDRGALERLVEEHVTGRRDRGFLLWKMFQLALWTREYL